MGKYQTKAETRINPTKTFTTVTYLEVFLKENLSRRLVPLISTSMIEHSYIGYKCNSNCRLDNQLVIWLADRRLRISDSPLQPYPSNSTI